MKEYCLYKEVKLLIDDDGLHTRDAVNADDKQEQRIRCPQGVCQNAVLWVRSKIVSRPDETFSRQEVC